MSDQHYLKDELYELVRCDPSIFDFLQQGSLDGLWYWDLKKPDHEWMNPGFWELLGYDPAEKKHLASEWQDIIFAEDLPTALDNFEKHCADPNHPYDQIVRYRHRDGSTVWVRCRGVVIRDEEGRPSRMLGAHNDLTSEKRAEEALRQHARALSQANADLEQFAYVTSHDLQTPLRTIKSFVGLLERRLDDQLEERERGYIRHIHDAVDDMSQLIQDLLAYSRLEHEESREEVNLGRVLASVELGLTSIIEESEATIRCESLPTVVGNATMLRQLFQNLIENAIKYSDPDRPPEIDLRCRAVGGVWRISVADNGLGIEAKYFDRIFELFQKLHAGQGSGVGLALCRRIVHLQGGALSVTSELDVGSTFIFTLPTERGARGAGRGGERRARPQGFGEVWGSFWPPRRSSGADGAALTMAIALGQALWGSGPWVCAPPETRAVVRSSQLPGPSGRDAET